MLCHVMHKNCNIVEYQVSAQLKEKMSDLNVNYLFIYSDWCGVNDGQWCVELRGSAQVWFSSLQ